MMILPPPAKRLQAMLDNHVDNFGAVGVIAGIDLPGRDRLRLVAGRRERDGASLDAGQLYQVGSQTKTLVALAILLLCRDGAIELDAPAASHVSLPLDPRITIRHLITNTSGIREYLPILQGSPADALAPKDLVIPALGQDLLFPPGHQYDYSNTGWVIAAMLLDATTPGGYAGFVRERIFKPLAMDDSHVASGHPEDRLAQGYLKFRDGRLLPAPDGFSMTRAYGAGDIISTCDDMIALYRALSRPANPLGLSFADMTVSWCQSAERPIHPGSLGSAYAFGLERRSWGGLEVWGHPGRTPGYGASTWYVPATGAIVTTAFMYTEDEGEPPLLAAQRYNAPLLFTEVLATAHALHDMASAPAQAGLVGAK